MNQKQCQYALERLQDIYRTKLNKLKDECTTKGVSLSLDEKKEAFIKGEYTPKSVSELNRCGSWNTSVVFNAESPDVVDKVKYNKAEKKLFKDYTKACDELMLGDSTVAKKLIEDFAK